MQQSERTYSSGYRFGFNGKENDEETIETGEGSEDYGYRIYNPSLGRFFSVDPITCLYPSLSPYQFASNTPIVAVDWDGLEARTNTLIRSDGSTVITITVALKVKNSANLPENQLIGLVAKIANQIEESYKGYDPITKTTYRTLVDIDFQDKTINTQDDYYLDLTNQINKKHPTWIGLTGYDDSNNGIGSTERNRMQILVKGRTDDQIVRTGAHEIGHSLGLRHSRIVIDKNGKDRGDKLNPLTLGKDNLMRQEWDGKGKRSRISIAQLKIIYKTINNKSNFRQYMRKFWKKFKWRRRTHVTF